MAGFDTHSDAAQSAREDERQARFEKLCEEKYDEIRSVLSSEAGAAAFIYDNEPELALLLSALVNGNFKLATMELERMIEEAAFNQAEGELL